MKIKSNINALKFIIWLFIASSIMMFTGITSAYIVSRTGLLNHNKWLIFKLPFYFYISTFISLVGIIITQYIYLLNNKIKYKYYKTLLVLLLLNSMLFLFLQFKGLQDMIKNNIYLSGNIAGSYIYIIAVIHGLHIIFGVIAIIYHIFLKDNKNNLYKDVYLKSLIIYWHFVHLLWIYLFVFLIINR